jgi:hypothetical protein
MAAQLSLIEAHENTLSQILSDTYAFEIPSHQRSSTARRSDIFTASAFANILALRPESWTVFG